jgi:hypothetical protein
MASDGNTKLRGDIAEQAAVLHGLKKGYGVLRPVGDRLPYDLVFDIDGTLLKIQVKLAWYSESVRGYCVVTRRTKTNRRITIVSRYSEHDFDFALAYIQQSDLFYVFPVDAFLQYRSQICMIEDAKRQRRPGSAIYRDAWHLMDNKIEPSNPTQLKLIA